MKVYVLTGSLEYEGNYLLGVYATNEDAENALKEYTKVKKVFDDYDITSVVVGSKAELFW